MFKALLDYNRLLVPIYLLIGLAILGTIGYYFLCDYSLMNAFYMTVITIATVGYGEVQPLDDNGRIFTAVLIIISFGTFAYAVSSITRFVIDGEFNQIFKHRKLVREVEKLKGHVIICGYGRNGRQAAQVLKKANRKFVVVEKDPELIKSMSERHSELVIVGDATRDEILQQAGIINAAALITTLPIDADNLFIVLTARNLNKKLTIIARASEDNSYEKLKIAGADNVIMPDKVGGAHMASLVMKPDVVEFLEIIESSEDESINLEEVNFANIPENLKGKTLRDLEIRNRSGANIIGFKTAEGKYIINPSADTVIIPEGKIFVLGTWDQIHKLKAILSNSSGIS